MSSPSETPPPAATPPGPRLPPKLAKLFERYGTVAIVTYGILSVLTWAAALTAIFLGVQWGNTPAATEPAPTTGFWSVVGGCVAPGTLVKIVAAWAVTRVTVPIRIGVTVVLTPLVARLWDKVRARRA